MSNCTPAQCVSSGFFGGVDVDYKCVARVREQERDDLRKERNKLLANSTLSYVGLLTFENLCPVFHENGVTFTENGRREAELQKARDCYFGRFDAASRARAIMNAQALLGESQDGWLRSDQAARLICRGVEQGNKNHPASDRYAGWMFATGMGLPRNKKVALELLNRARQFLNGQPPADSIGNNRSTIAYIDESVARLSQVEDVEVTPAADSAEIARNCTGALDAIKQQATLTRRERIAGARVAAAPVNQNVRELVFEQNVPVTPIEPIPGSDTPLP